MNFSSSVSILFASVLCVRHVNDIRVGAVAQIVDETPTSWPNRSLTLPQGKHAPIPTTRHLAGLPEAALAAPKPKKPGPAKGTKSRPRKSN